VSVRLFASSNNNISYCHPPPFQSNLYLPQCRFNRWWCDDWPGPSASLSHRFLSAAVFSVAGVHGGVSLLRFCGGLWWFLEGFCGGGAASFFVVVLNVVHGGFLWVVFCWPNFRVFIPKWGRRQRKLRRRRVWKGSMLSIINDLSTWCFASVSGPWC